MTKPDPLAELRKAQMADAAQLALHAYAAARRAIDAHGGPHDREVILTLATMTLTAYLHDKK